MTGAAPPPLADAARAVLMAEALGTLQDMGLQLQHLQMQVANLQSDVTDLPVDRWIAEMGRHLEHLKRLDLREIGSSEMSRQMEVALAAFQYEVRRQVQHEARRNSGRHQFMLMSTVFLIGVLSASVFHLWR